MPRVLHSYKAISVTTHTYTHAAFWRVYVCVRRYVPWPAQYVGYEILRAEVAGLARTHPRAAERVSYADLHALAGTNGCGFTTRFPHYNYYPLDKKVLPPLPPKLGAPLRFD